MEVKSGSSVYVMDNVISDELCDTLKIVIDKTKRTKFEYNKHNNVLCESISIRSIENQKFAKILDDQIYQCISDAVNRLFCINNFIVNISSDDGYTFRKILGETRLHSDSVFSDSIENLPKDSPIRRDVRKISVIIALNGDYEGGEFYFPSQGIDKIKLKKGQAILFPPYWTHPHGVNKPENNTFRYTINTWLLE